MKFQVTIKRISTTPDTRRLFSAPAEIEELVYAQVGHADSIASIVSAANEAFHSASQPQEVTR